MLVIAYATRRSLVEPDFATTIQESLTVWDGEAKNTQIFQNIHDLSVTASSTLGTNRADVLDHLRSVQRVYFIEVPESEAGQLEAWARQTSSILLAGGKLLDPSGYSLASDEASVPVLDERLERAKKWRKFLQTRSVEVPDTVRPVRAAGEVTPQTDQVVGLRTLSLALCVMGEYLTSENLDAPDNFLFPRAIAAMTQSERENYPKSAPLDSAEALKELLWATRRVHIDWPDSPVDGLELAGPLLLGSEDKFVANTKLRNVEELLDEQERMASLAWAMSNGQEIGADETIVFPRLATITWLLNRVYGWDEIYLNPSLTF
ncbi:DUF4272 domain-containing protein [Propionimicrobium lymphophilum]|uniref:DUF4272 domain-containing protein n=1 Tax=Propionimicrobium lymphophilum ACS-093-V-SCH5 TaxID=883161 RepID=S2VZT5_9ACTN|nr:DUF4272 domain-containing protein [Propionimicrobium lymphophilum]EPD32386.1 hypothetical protein HMPREF9306_01956 [Propionimicrobium lymphophilum ACS-093-V-SCH5]MDK7710757.1 DUF4272 domain-containing protein [Propionimicrobium lymphophilum]MDK7734431.1 DUF4272 domain-containing protein [Propionimicrobium lymphophilum]